MPAPKDAAVLKKLDEMAKMLPGAKAAKAMSPADLCKNYASIRPFLLKILPWVKKIPRFGKPLAAAIAFLMKLADVVCNVV